MLFEMKRMINEEKPFIPLHHAALVFTSFTSRRILAIYPPSMDLERGKRIVIIVIIIACIRQASIKVKRIIIGMLIRKAFNTRY